MTERKKIQMDDPSLLFISENISHNYYLCQHRCGD